MDGHSFKTLIQPLITRLDDDVAHTTKEIR